MKKFSLIITLLLSFNYLSIGQYIGNDSSKVSNPIKVIDSNNGLSEESSDFQGVLDFFNPFSQNNNDRNKPSNVFSAKSIKNNYLTDNNVVTETSFLNSKFRDVPLSGYINNISNILRKNKSSIDIAYGILNKNEVKGNMKINSIDNFYIIDTVTDKLGITHVKMNQYLNGLLIFGGQIYIHFKNKIDIETPSAFINGKWFEEDIESRATIPNIGKSKEKVSDFLISEDKVKRIVFRNMRSNGIQLRNLSKLAKYLQEEEQWSIQKVYYPRESDKKLIPAYVASVVADPIHRYKYIVDGKDGEVLLKHDMHCSFIDEKTISPPNGATTANARDLNGKNRKINVYERGGNYYMLDISRTMYNPSKSNLPDEPVGAIWTIDANYSHPNSSAFKNKLDHVLSNNNTWNSKVAVSAHFNAGFAYDYYKNVHGRNSIDGKGGNIVSIINIVEEDGAGMDNAFWGGKAMYYGNGNNHFSSPLAKALDVSGHELTHGVIQNTANLEYYGESGAINESFADIFGAMMDRDDWKMGEDVVNKSKFTSGALRNLSNPHNGGSSLNHLGYQPAHTNEQFKGKEDNYGVHINSGIPNFAFYKFATSVGKDKAEKVYYRALTYYLTLSSDFEDLRVAVEKAASDLYGEDIKNKVSKAFSEVGIGGSGGGNPKPNQSDLNINPGTDYVLCTDVGENALYLFDSKGVLLNAPNPLIEVEISSKPSVTDNGDRIIYVGKDKKIHQVISWLGSNIKDEIIQSQAIWRNAIVAKDGSRIAALTENIDDKVHVYDYKLGEWKEFILKNPTSAQGVELGNVEYADAMEFDYSGEWIMYDCKNDIGNGIKYWDIGFINIWNNKNSTFEEGRTTKLFSDLDKGVSVGNPSFSKNSPYIIAFDYIDDEKYLILGANIETGAVDKIYENNGINYPNFSKNDDKVVFNYIDENNNDYLGIINVDNSKIKAIDGTAKYFTSEYYGIKWAIWISTGDRLLSTSTNDLPDNTRALNTFIYPNPVSGNTINVESEDFLTDVKVEVYSVLGKRVVNKKMEFSSKLLQLDVSELSKGYYILKIRDSKKDFVTKFNVFR